MTEEIAVKAYDPKVLVAKLKAKGMDVAEEAAAVLVEEVIDWVVESSVISPNKVDDLLAVMLPVAKTHILSLVDKIDGQDDPNR